MENIIRLKEKDGYWLAKYYEKFAIFRSPEPVAVGEPAKKLEKLFEFDNLEDAEKYFDGLKLD